MSESPSVLTSTSRWSITAVSRTQCQSFAQLHGLAVHAVRCLSVCSPSCGRRRHCLRAPDLVLWCQVCFHAGVKFVQASLAPRLSYNNSSKFCCQISGARKHASRPPSTTTEQRTDAKPNLLRSSVSFKRLIVHSRTSNQSNNNKDGFQVFGNWQR